MKLIRRLVRLARQEDAATMTEYGVMVALIAAVSVGIVTSLGGSVSSAFNAIVSAL